MTEYIWYAVGFGGTIIFSARWVIQLAASAKAKRSTFPLLFWYTSILGSLMLLSYFAIWLKDPVGIVANFFPAIIAVYNLTLEYKKKAVADRKQVDDAGDAGTK